MGQVRSVRGNGLIALESVEVIYVQKSSKLWFPAVASRSGVLDA